MRILVGYEGSDEDKEALDLARQRAKVLRAEVVHVLYSKVTD
jgi:nucleotide-binding universal stress UspA family protein